LGDTFPKKRRRYGKKLIILQDCLYETLRGTDPLTSSIQKQKYLMPYKRIRQGGAYITEEDIKSGGVYRIL